MAKRLRVLVVDDTDDARDAMVEIVRRTGHVADEAADGVEATVALSERSYDLMLLDLSMPRMGGEEVARWLLTHPDQAQGLRTVVVTAWAGDRPAQLRELGITTVLSKPFRMRHLVDLLNEVVADS